MAVTTSPDSIAAPATTDQISPLAPWFQALATSVQNALNTRPYKPADLAALAALTGMPAGSVAVPIEGSAQFVYTGTTWIQQTPATFASTGARDTAYAKVSGTYRVIGARATVAGVQWKYASTGWVMQEVAPTLLTLASGWTNLSGVATAKFQVAGGIVSVNGRLNAAAGVGDDTSAVLPVGARPFEEIVTNGSLNNALIPVILGTDGSIDYYGRGTTAQGDFRLGAIPPFPAGR